MSNGEGSEESATTPQWIKTQKELLRKATEQMGAMQTRIQARDAQSTPSGGITKIEPEGPVVDDNLRESLKRQQNEKWRSQVKKVLERTGPKNG